MTSYRGQKNTYVASTTRTKTWNMGGFSYRIKIVVIKDSYDNKFVNMFVSRWYGPENKVTNENGFRTIQLHHMIPVELFDRLSTEFIILWGAIKHLDASDGFMESRRAGSTYMLTKAFHIGFGGKQMSLNVATFFNGDPLPEVVMRARGQYRNAYKI